MSSSTALGASAPSPIPVPVDSSISAAPGSLWDRISTWASEHKAAVYTIAGVTLVVTGAGVVYYMSEPKTGPSEEAATGKKKAKKNKRKTKDVEKGEAAPTEKAQPEAGTFRPQTR